MRAQTRTAIEEAFERAMQERANELRAELERQRALVNAREERRNRRTN